MKILKEDVIQDITKKWILGSISTLEAKALLQHIPLVKAQHTSCQRPYENSFES